MSKKLFIASQAPFVEMPVTSSKDIQGRTFTIKVGFKQYATKQAIEVLELFSSLKDEDSIVSKLKEQILYLKDVELAIYDEETLALETTKKISDTRKVESFEPFWKDKDDCLVVLLDNYFASSFWLGSFIDVFIQTLTNSPKEENQAKN